MNQVISTHNSNHSGSFTKTPRMAYQADHYPECCTGNVNRSMPNFIYKAFMRCDGGYVFNFYIPGTYRAGQAVFCVNTEYPYREAVGIVYDGAEADMRLKLRIPSWCKKFSCECTFKTHAEGGWLVAEGHFRKGDKILLRLPSEVEVVDVGEGYVVSKQPLLFTLKIDCDINIDKTEKRQKPGFAAYDVTPASGWQIGIDKDTFLRTFNYVECNSADLLHNDCRITAKGYFLEGVNLKKIHSSLVPVSDYDRQEIVKLRRMGQVIYDGEMVFTPAISELGPAKISCEDIVLIPYSTAMLRWTVFPKIAEGKSVKIG